MVTTQPTTQTATRETTQTAAHHYNNNNNKISFERARVCEGNPLQIAPKMNPRTPTATHGRHPARTRSARAPHALRARATHSHFQPRYMRLQDLRAGYLWQKVAVACKKVAKSLEGWDFFRNFAAVLPLRATTEQHERATLHHYRRLQPDGLQRPNQSADARTAGTGKATKRA